MDIKITVAMYLSVVSHKFRNSQYLVTASPGLCSSSVLKHESCVTTYIALFAGNMLWAILQYFAGCHWHCTSSIRICHQSLDSLH